MCEFATSNGTGEFYFGTFGDFYFGIDRRWAASCRCAG